MHYSPINFVFLQTNIKKPKTMKPRIMMISMKSNLRTMRYIGLLLMFIFCLTAQNMMAQRGKLFNSDNQLSSNLATQVFQDSNGFIWIATRNGLNIYDGYNFMVIRKTYGMFRLFETSGLFVLCLKYFLIRKQ